MSDVIICEYEFRRPDRDNPKYSQAEVDYYSHIPYDPERKFRQHRLSLRKNLEDGKFEVYRRFSQTIVVSRGPVTAVTQKDENLEEIVFSGTLQEAINIATRETNKFWEKLHGTEKVIDQVCLHDKQPKHYLCDKLKQMEVGT